MQSSAASPLLPDDLEWISKAVNLNHPLGKFFDQYGKQKWNDGFLSGLLLGIVSTSTVVTFLYGRGGGRPFY
jgi:hypothetical protein